MKLDMAAAAHVRGRRQLDPLTESLADLERELSDGGGLEVRGDGR
jgi:hypothetical protein